MATNKMIARIKSILTTPTTEWPVIAAEPATPAGLYQNYILILAAIPAVCGFIKMSFLGHSLPLLGDYKIGVGAGLKASLMSYLLSLVGVYLMALLISALAGKFGGEKNTLQALKTATYAYTASWVAGIGELLPWIGGLVMIAGGIYSIYLLYLGLPHTMKCPPERAKSYTAVTMLIAIVLSLLIGIVAGGAIGLHTPTPGANTSGEEPQFDPNSTLGKLQQLGKRAEEASRKMDEAQKSGDTEAQQQAMRDMVGAVLGGGNTVESLAPERLEPFVPQTLAGMPRSEYSAGRNGAMGMQFSTAEATYADTNGEHSLHLEITDMGSAKGLMALAGWAAFQQDTKTDHGYEKTYKENGRMMHEQWNSESKEGEYAAVLGERFIVKVDGTVDSMDALKSALDGIDLAALEALKSEGVKTQ